MLKITPNRLKYWNSMRGKKRWEIIGKRKARISSKKQSEFPRKRNGIIIKCKYCGKKKYVGPRNIGKTKFCSSVCYHKSNTGKMNGLHHSKKTKKLIGLSNLGHKGSWKGKHLPKKIRRKISLIKQKYLKTHKNNMFGKHHTEESKRKIRIKALKRIKEIGFHEGKNERKILNRIEKENGIKLHRQYPIIGYSIDGYDKKNNIAYEVDEKHHKNNIKKDKERENNIKKELRCKFIRIREIPFLRKYKMKDVM
jgi:very-short-patch-repair endonuclease